VSLVVGPSRRRVPPGERVCFRVRALDASRCDTNAPEVQWGLRRTSGDGDAALAGSCVTAQANATGAEFVLSAVGGGFTAQATLAVVSAEQYQGLLAAHLEDSDAGDLTAVDNRPSGPQLGGAAVRPPTAVPSSQGAALPWLVLAGVGLVGLGAMLAGLARGSRRARGPREEPSEGLGGRTPPPAAAPLASPTAQTMDLRAPPSVVVSPEGPAAPAAPVAPEPAPAAAHGGRKQCPRCNGVQPGTMLFCPLDGTALVPLSGAAAAVAPQRCPQCHKRYTDGSRFCADDGATLVAETASPADGVCPTCGRRYPPPLQFCGEDGAALTRTGC
jgi:hypothetical protein